MSIFLLGLGVLGGLLDLRSQPIIGFLIIILLCAPLIAWIIGLRRGATYIEIGTEEITRSLFFQKTVIRWEEVTNIRTGWAGHEPVQVTWNREVMIDYRRAGNEHVLTISNKIFGLNSEELMSLLMPFYENARKLGNPQAVSSARMAQAAE